MQPITVSQQYPTRTCTIHHMQNKIKQFMLDLRALHAPGLPCSGLSSSKLVACGPPRTSCSHGVEAQRQREPREGNMSCVCPYIDVKVVSWTGGASRCPHDATRGTNAPCLSGYARMGTALHRGLDNVLFGHVSSSSGAGGASSSSSWCGHPGWSSDGR
jgi:hypothetical protein